MEAYNKIKKLGKGNSGTVVLAERKHDSFVKLSLDSVSGSEEN